MPIPSDGPQRVLNDPANWQVGVWYERDAAGYEVSRTQDPSQFTDGIYVCYLGADDDGNDSWKINGVGASPEDDPEKLPDIDSSSGNYYSIDTKTVTLPTGMVVVKTTEHYPPGVSADPDSLEPGAMAFVQPDGSTIYRSTKVISGGIDDDPGGPVEDGGGDEGGGDEGGEDGGSGEDGGGDEGGDAGGGACFVASTPVLLATGEYAPIERIIGGDLVRSRHEFGDEEAAQPVTAIHEHTVEACVALTLGNGEQLITTSEHRFALKRGGFRACGDLRRGDELVAADHSFPTVAATRSLAGRRTVYNLSIGSFKTYFVGFGGVLVHNVKKSDGTDDDNDERE